MWIKLLKELLSPSFRKLYYLYANHSDKEKCRFVIGRKPELLEAGKTNAGLGVVEFKDKVVWLEFQLLIDNLILKDGKTVDFCVLNLANLSTLLDKYKKDIHPIYEKRSYVYDEETFKCEVDTPDKKKKVLYETIKPFFWKKAMEYMEELNRQLDNPQFKQCEEIENVSNNLRIATGNKLRLSVLKGIEELGNGGKGKKKEILSPVLWQKKNCQHVYCCGGYMENDKFRFLTYRPSLWYMEE